eukprot:SAG11_NODE_56_length_19295_cov_20.219675_13_plen_281_part_00
MDYEMVLSDDLSQLISELIEKDDQITALKAQLHGMPGAPILEQIPSLRVGTHKNSPLRDMYRDIAVDLAALVCFESCVAACNNRFIYAYVRTTMQEGISGNKSLTAMERVIDGMVAGSGSRRPVEGKIVAREALFRHLIAERSEILQLDMAVRLAQANGFEPSNVCEPALAQDASALPPLAQQRVNAVYEPEKDTRPEVRTYEQQVTLKHKQWTEHGEKPPDHSKGEQLEVGNLAEVIRTERVVGESTGNTSHDGVVDHAAGCACLHASHDGTTHMRGIT